jgi:hypothetical protein
MRWNDFDLAKCWISDAGQIRARCCRVRPASDGRLYVPITVATGKEQLPQTVIGVVVGIYDVMNRDVQFILDKMRIAKVSSGIARVSIILPTGGRQ